MSGEGEALGSGLLSDAAETLGLAPCAVGGFRLTHPDRVVWGRAFTLRQVLLDEVPEGAARQGEVAEQHLSPGDVLIISAPPGAGIATWGEGHALRALGSGAAGVVVDGAIRDVTALAALALPVLFRGATPLRSKGRLVTAEIGGTITIGTVAINPGDFVCFDADGLVAIASADEPAVRTKAMEIHAWELERNSRLRQRIAPL